MLNCIDNSGAALVECALVVGQKRHARIGTTSPFHTIYDPQSNYLNNLRLLETNYPQ